MEKNAEEMMRDYEKERERLDKFLADDEERRQQLLEQYSKFLQFVNLRVETFMFFFWLSQF